LQDVSNWRINLKRKFVVRRFDSVSNLNVHSQSAKKHIYWRYALNYSWTIVYCEPRKAINYAICHIHRIAQSIRFGTHCLNTKGKESCRHNAWHLCRKLFLQLLREVRRLVK
jgi:hypothetical protein